MVLLATTNGTTGTVTGPDGWTLVDSVTSPATSTTSLLWSRVADDGDAGSSATVTNTTIAKTALQLSAYANAGAISAHAVATDTVNRADRTTPIVPVATAGSMLVSHWADKSGSNTGWTVPAGVRARAT